MEYIKLGRTNLNVSRICLGCFSFGEPIKTEHEWCLNQEETDAMIKRALELGINFFDTANCYSDGTSEKFIGNSFKKYVKDRKDIIIASKVRVNEGGLSKEAIYREIDKSLKNLQTDYLDLYIIHRWDYNVDIEETMSALNDLVVQKKVRFLGCSAVFPYQLLKANLIARQHGWAEFLTIQNHYNIVYREEEKEMLQLLEEENIVKRFSLDPINYRKYEHAKEEDMPIIQRIKELSDKKGVSMAQISIAWILRKKLVTSPIIGFTKISQLEDMVNVFKVQLNDDEMKYLEELYRPHKIVGAEFKGERVEIRSKK